MTEAILLLLLLGTLWEIIWWLVKEARRKANKRRWEASLGIPT